MSWFDEQIKARYVQDDERLEESFINVAASVLGKKGTTELANERMYTKDAIDEILKYHHFKPIVIPDRIKDLTEGIEYCLRPYGMMRRRVSLEKGWYKKAYGPMLGWVDDTPVSLLPGKFGGYTYTDPKTGKRTHVGRSNADSFREEAYCFYKPLPVKKIGIKDLITYMVGCLSFGDVLRVVIYTLLFSMVGLLIPNITQAVIGPVVSTGSTRLLVTAGITLVMIRLSMILFDAAKELVVERMKLGTSLSVEAAVMTRLLQLNVSFFRRFSAGDLSTRAMSIQELCDIIIEEFFGMGLLSISSLLYIIQIVRFGPELVLPSLGVVFLTFAIMVVGTVIRMRITKKHMQHEAKLMGMEYDLISGIRKIRLAGAENSAFSRWAASYAQGAKLVYDPPLFLKVEPVIRKMILLCGTLAIYYLSVTMKVDVADYYAFNAAYGVIMGAFVTLGSSVVQLSHIKPAMKLAEPILEEQPEISKNKKPIATIRGHVALSHVSFRYDKNAPYILNDVSMEIGAGDYVAIIGKTGCGKSTLVRLLLGFETPEKGAVYYGRQDVSRVDLKSLRSQIGVVLQGGELIPGSIFENIALVSPGLTVEEAWEAADIAGIGDDIRQMPMGMSTIISEGQGGISGGQKQRLLIARAVASKPKVMIFDEATSALDNRTQKRVTEALGKLDCTRIVIAHRLSTIRDCDRVFVLEDGKITEKKEGSSYE